MKREKPKLRQRKSMVNRTVKNSEEVEIKSEVVKIEDVKVEVEEGRFS